jgi:cell division protein FtsZ
VDDGARTVIAVAVGALTLLLVVRVTMALPGWIHRLRRPESRAIRVVGVGGGGSNAVDRMLEEGVAGVDFVAVNTDAQALRRSRARGRIRIGQSSTGGLGSGGDPEVGRQAAEEDADLIEEALDGADLVFVTAGLGGGTGSGAAPLVARHAREQGALTIGVVTKPFAFEGPVRARVADEASERLLAEVDALVTIPNDRMADVLSEDASVVESFRAVDGVLVEAVQGILGLLSGAGLINLDFADVRAVVRGSGRALIGVGRGRGDDRAVEAARRAIASPLLEAGIRGARSILFNVAGPDDLTLREVRTVADAVRASADAEANIIFGASRAAASGDLVTVTVIATGLDGSSDAEAAAEAPVAASTSVVRADPSPLATPRPSELHPPALRPRSSARPRRTVTVPEVVAARSAPARSAPAIAPADPADDYDIPSFLRRGRAASGGRP